MSKKPRLILASASQTRINLLQQAGLQFTAINPNVDEASLKHTSKSQTPENLALILAKAKATAIIPSTNPNPHHEEPDTLVIGADQTLSLGDRLFDKCTTPKQVREVLLSLSGKTHQLHSAVAVAHQGEIIWSHCDTAEMTMHDFSDTTLERYIEDEGSSLLSSIGCYKIEGRGIQLFSSITGDFFTILGLPMLPLLNFLRQHEAMPE